MHQRRQCQALNVRALQTELMVGELACGERERYNDFIQARQPELVPYAKTLQRMHGKRTNAFVTRVANTAPRNADCDDFVFNIKAFGLLTQPLITS